jgi:hypothetical protein
VLCDPSIVRVAAAECSPDDTFTVAFGAKKRRQLLVVDDPDRLAGALRAGLAGAVCDFQPLFMSEGADAEQRYKAICEMAHRFAAP